MGTLGILLFIASLITTGLSTVMQVNAQSQAQEQAAAQAQAQIKYQAAMNERQQAIYAQQAKNATAQAEWQNQMFLANADNANEAYLQEVRAINESIVQDEEVVSQDKQNITKQRAQAVGRALASSDVAGLGLEMLIGDINRREANYNDAVDKNYGFTLEQKEREKKGRQIATSGRISQSAPSPTTVPVYQPYVGSPINYKNNFNPWGTILQGAGQAINTTNRFYFA